MPNKKMSEKTKQKWEKTKKRWSDEYKQELEKMNKAEEKTKYATPDEQSNLGYIYNWRLFKTTGMKKKFSKARSKKKAIYWYTKAMRRGCGQGAFHLSHMAKKDKEYHTYLLYLHVAGHLLYDEAIKELIKVYEFGWYNPHNSNYPTWVEANQKQVIFWQKKLEEHKKRHKAILFGFTNASGRNNDYFKEYIEQQDKYKLEEEEKREIQEPPLNVKRFARDYDWTELCNLFPETENQKNLYIQEFEEQQNEYRTFHDLKYS